MRHILKFFRTCFWPLWFCFASACTTLLTPSLDYGVQPDYKSYIPARIAILECQVWPQNAYYSRFVLSNIESQTKQDICKVFDEYILKSFSNQPYMKGLSPRGVVNLLQENQKDQILKDWGALFYYDPNSCKECDNIPSFYSRTVKPRQEWQNWLLEISRHTKSSDAILIPFISHVWEKREDDRGIEIARRSLNVDLLLIDTHSGDLLWAGQNRNLSRQQKNVFSPEDVLNFPAWEDLYSKVFSEPLWMAFPGRLTL